jgi:hypothetical protein
MVTVPVRQIARVIVVVVFATVLVLAWKSWNEGYWPFCCDQDQWTAVWLANGSGYYGHYYDAPGEYARLYEPYYLITTQAQSQPNTPPQTQFTVVQRGIELHGPRSPMRISKEQILFTEDLRSDSTVVQTIRQIRSGATQPSQPAPAATSSASPTR